MKRLVILVLCLASVASAKTEWARRKATDSLRDARMKIGGKERTYSSFNHDTPARVSVLGPTKLRVLVRLDFAKEDPAEVPFCVDVEMDEQPSGVQERTATRSATATFLDEPGRVPGIRHAFELEIPAGTHTVALRLHEAGRVAVVAFYLPKGKAGFSRVSMSPTEYQETVVEVYQEKERTWYLGGGEKGVSLDLIGPTNLSVLTSLEFDPSLRGSQSYTVTVLVDGAPTKDFSLTTVRSEIRSYRDRAEVVPGVEKSFSFSIAEGQHKVAFILKGTEAKLCAYRFLLPAKDVSRER